MPLTSARPKEAEVIVQGDTAVVQAGEQPVFLWLEQSKRGTQNAESDLDAACSVGS
jgi:hypothetical protein